MLLKLIGNTLTHHLGPVLSALSNGVMHITIIKLATHVCWPHPLTFTHAHVSGWREAGVYTCARVYVYCVFVFSRHTIYIHTVLFDCTPHLQLSQTKGPMRWIDFVYFTPFNCTQCCCCCLMEQSTTRGHHYQAIYIYIQCFFFDCTTISNCPKRKDLWGERGRQKGEGEDEKKVGQWVKMDESILCILPSVVVVA